MKHGTRGGQPGPDQERQTDRQRQADGAHLEHLLPGRNNHYFDIYESGHAEKYWNFVLGPGFSLESCIRLHTLGVSRDKATSPLPGAGPIL